MGVNFKRDLNDEQYSCVSAGDGPLYVLAGAGTGKTRVLTYRTAWLIDNGVPPNHIMLLTFTNKAAKEMLERVELLTGLNLRNLWGGTFHHIGNLMLRRKGRSYGISPDFVIIDEGDSLSLLNVCKDKLRIPKEAKFPKTSLIKNIISTSANSMKDIPETVTERFPYLINFCGDIEKIGKLYRKKKTDENLMDFDDLLFHWFAILQNGARVHNLEHILVDEYQDTNLLQAKITDEMARHIKNIMVVGDDAQSIYSFRGADYRNIRDFPDRYSNVKIYKLETNYRSTPQILNLANKIIERSDARFKKRLIPVKKDGGLPCVVAARDTNWQAKFVVYKIQEFVDKGFSYRDIGVLYRAHYQSVELEIELSKTGIPYVVRSGVRFFERAHIKDILSYLRVIANPGDSISFTRMLKLEEGIGDVNAQRIFEIISHSPSPLKKFFSFKPKMSKRITSGIKSARKKPKSIINLSPSDMIKFIFDEGYQEYLKLSYPDALEREEDILTLIAFATGYKSLLRFLSEASLSEPISGNNGYLFDRNKDRVVLSTVHRAKGLEWPIVFLIYLCGGGFPIAKSYESPEQYEEERRLFYVGVTRAKDELYLVYPQKTVRNPYLVESPFLKELNTNFYRMIWM